MEFMLNIALLLILDTNCFMDPIASFMFKIALFFLILYFALMLAFTHGWRSLNTSAKVTMPKPFFSLVVCAHNESNALPTLLQSIDKQTYKDFEVILVDDHSTDDTLRLMTDWATMRKECEVLSSTKRGKKGALGEAVRHCKGEYILQTDADCLLAPRWVEAVATELASQGGDMLVCPVRMEGDGLWGKIQSLEFMSLVASGAAAVGLGRPIMCNGAALAYRRSLREELSDELHDDIASGDDMFLLLGAKRRGRLITFMKRADAFVTTSASTSLREFLRQRMRWSSKSLFYRDIDVIATACIVLVPSLLTVVFLFSGMFSLALMVLASKGVSDTVFLSRVSSFFGYKKLLWLIPMVELFYPLYVIVCGLIGLLSSKKKW